MAEEMVVEDYLSPAMMAGGAELTRKLDQVGFPVAASLWYYDGDVGRWRFIIASPRVESEGTLATYGQILDALKQIPAEAARVPILSLKAVPPSDPLIGDLSGYSRYAASSSAIRIKENLVGRTYIEDAYVYRLPAGSH